MSKLKTKKSQNFKREFSAGTVVYKKSRKLETGNWKLLFLLGKHSGYHKWVLPKGLIEEGERGWQTAVRETEEEMGVRCHLISDKPIHIEKYIYWADLKKLKTQNSKLKTTIKNSKLEKSTRRVEKYKEEGGGKTKVFKTVSFYLAEYVSGDPENHGWEMEEASWFEYEKALGLMSFKGEKEAFKKAKFLLENLPKQPKLL